MKILMGKFHLIQSQQWLIEIFKEPPPPPHIISQGKYTEELFVRAKLWRSDYDQVHESCVDRRQFLNLVTWDVSSLISQLSPTKGVKGDPRGLQCMSIFPSPHPLSSRKLKKALKLPSHRYLPTPNISISPSSLNFRPDFSLLPIVYLPLIIYES